MSNEPGYHCSLTYWRKSKINGARTVPILMRLDVGRLAARDRDGTIVFDAPAATTHGRLTKLGTLVLDVGGRGYEIVGRGSAVSPKPSEGQRREFLDFWADRPFPAPLQGGAGTLDEIFNGAAAWHMRTWRDALVAAGASIA